MHQCCTKTKCEITRLSVFSRADKAVEHGQFLGNVAQRLMPFILQMKYFALTVLWNPPADANRQNHSKEEGVFRLRLRAALQDHVRLLFLTFQSYTSSPLPHTHTLVKALNKYIRTDFRCLALCVTGESPAGGRSGSGCLVSGRPGRSPEAAG